MSIITQLNKKIVPLAYRSIISVTGKDARILLQGIGSNDFMKNKQSTFFSVFLNPKGKLFCDSLVTFTQDNSIMLDIPTAFAPNMMKLLQMSILRLDAKINLHNDISVSATLSNDIPNTIQDPRFKTYSVYRRYEKCDPKVDSSLTSLFKTFELLNGVWSSDDNIKNLHCGSINLDLLEGASKTKGCYVGQEVYNSYTHTHKVLNRIVPVLLTPQVHPSISTSITTKAICEDFEYSITKPESIKENDKHIGKLIYMQPGLNVGLALINEFEGVHGQWIVGEKINVIPIVN